MARKALGRGLSSLLGPGDPSTEAVVLQVPIAEISANRYQPREHWDEPALEDLASSIREHGILQPLVLRGRAGQYELIAGERRLRAAQKAGLQMVPAILREADDASSLQLALIENVQREDISPVEAARAYQALMQNFQMTQEEVSRAVGKSRPAVANLLRLLRLPDEVLEGLRTRAISEGHARALLAVEDAREQKRLFHMALGGATVREIEAAARPPDLSTAVATPVTRTPTRPPASPHLKAAVDELRRALGLKVEIRGDEESGVLSVEYYSPEDLQDLVDRLTGKLA